MTSSERSLCHRQTDRQTYAHIYIYTQAQKHRYIHKDTHTLVVIHTEPDEATVPCQNLSVCVLLCVSECMDKVFVLDCHRHHTAVNYNRQNTHIHTLYTLGKVNKLSVNSYPASKNRPN